MKTTSLFAGLAIAASLAISPVAAQAPTSEETCFELLDNVQTEVSEKDLSPDATDSVEKLLDDLSNHCAEGQFEDASKTAKAIRDLLAKMT